MRTFLFILLFFSLSSHSQYNYQQLRVKEYEEMEQILKQRVTRSRKAAKQDGEAFEGALAELKQGLSILLMHPSDGTNSTLLALLKAEILNYTSFWRPFMDVVKDSLNILKSSSHSAIQRASHLYVLENVLAYIGNSNEEELEQILNLIAKAKIHVPKEVHTHRFMNASRARTTSPSLVAETMLRQRVQTREAKEKERKALEKKKKAEEALKKQKKKPSGQRKQKEKNNQ